MRILVVGAGIAGLGVARALRLRGFVAEVVESESAWTHAGAGIYLLASDKGAATAPISHFRMSPSVGRSGGRRDVTFSF